MTKPNKIRFKALGIFFLVTYLLIKLQEYNHGALSDHDHLRIAIIALLVAGGNCFMDFMILKRRRKWDEVESNRLEIQSLIEEKRKYMREKQWDDEHKTMKNKGFNDSMSYDDQSEEQNVKQRSNKTKKSSGKT